MSQYRKVSCVQCDQYTNCSLATRMFINYCGSQSEFIHKKIFAATTECRGRQRYQINQSFYIPERTALEPVPA
jgi:hypothetical protein